LITRRLNGDEQAANYLDMFAEQYEISTPRSSSPGTICTPDTTTICTEQYRTYIQ
jgi:hypothetical protein